MKKRAQRNVFLAAVTMLLLYVGCSAPVRHFGTRDAGNGIATMYLTAPGPNGSTRCVETEFDIVKIGSGGTAPTVTVETGCDDPMEVRALVPGEYRVVMNPDFICSVIPEGSMTPEIVEECEYLSEGLTFTVEAGEQTDVVLRFRFGPDVIVFSIGAAEVTLAVVQTCSMSCQQGTMCMRLNGGEEDCIRPCDFENDGADRQDDCPNGNECALALCVPVDEACGEIAIPEEPQSWDDFPGVCIPEDDGSGGQGGQGGAGGNAGTAGDGGDSGAGGSSGDGGTSGSGGDAGMSGSGGAGGDGGSSGGGAAGSAGDGGTGNAGAAGSGGSGGEGGGCDGNDGLCPQGQICPDDECVDDPVTTGGAAGASGSGGNAGSVGDAGSGGTGGTTECSPACASDETCEQGECVPAVRIVVEHHGLNEVPDDPSEHVTNYSCEAVDGQFVSLGEITVNGESRIGQDDVGPAGCGDLFRIEPGVTSMTIVYRLADDDPVPDFVIIDGWRGDRHPAECNSEPGQAGPDVIVSDGGRRYACTVNL